MNQTQKTKRFFLGYWNEVHRRGKTEEVLREYITDEKLISHILFFEKTFPNYKMVPQEIIAEEDRIFVRATLYAHHTGSTENVTPTMKEINSPFALGYRIKDDKIVDFWAIADQMELLEQLGLSSEKVEIKPSELMLE